MSRIPLGALEEFDNKTREFLQSMPPINLAQMLARTGVASEVYALIFALFDDNYLPAEDREIMLFRTCKNSDCSYESNFHKKTAHFSKEIAVAVLSEDISSLNPWAQKLCIASDEMFHEGKMSEASVDAFVCHYGSYDTACRAIFFLSWCNLTTLFVESTGVPLEDDSVLNNIKTPGWMTKGGV
ncbi:hypothetical protein [Microbulbifer epialgicus]|uniref:Alkylhydroperoxidase family enzyme, contains CxxC motif n=1 Tax=Microbulbifer epialgicus TaxID=393907 RepID=A0ABV4NZL7_9GAMM